MAAPEKSGASLMVVCVVCEDSIQWATIVLLSVQKRMHVEKKKKKKAVGKQAQLR
jgi:hypothetical protein